MTQHSLEELNKAYKDAESCDEEVFSEMRSNLLLVSGNHYSKKTTSFHSTIRNSQKLTENQKLRLTKNHIPRITKSYSQAINAKVPGVIPVPQNDLEAQDRKAADLNAAVWHDAKYRYNLKEKFREFVDNFVEIGEMCAYIYYDPNDGEFIGYEQAIDEVTQQPKVDEMGQMVPDLNKPRFSGAFQFKNIPGFNLLRAPQAKSMKTSPYVIIREMVDKKELELAYAGDPDKLKAIGEGDTDEFIVFDTNKRQYSEESEQILVRYHFYRSCKQYPNGYFYISTERGILEQDELPYGIWPIIWEGFDTFSTNPRGYSIIKVARPYQAEINRASSQAATHQITVGDDKIIYQGGTKLAQGALLPGVRGITYNGQPPQILPGRSGEQFLPYIESQITEMYAACMIEEISIDNQQQAQLDPYTLLFRAASQKAKFGRYIEKVEEFQKQFCMTYLEMAKKYLPDDAIVVAIGRSEAINIPEFKSTQPLSYQIRIEEQSEDISDRLGTQLGLNHLIQYAGQNLDPKQIALLAKEMPFLKNTSIVKRLTIDYTNAENDMLQLERGQMPFISPVAENKIYIDEITNRMKQSDFMMLSPQVRQLYDQYLTIHEDEFKRKELAQQQAKDGYIPIGGSLITVGMHLPDPNTSSGTRQVRLPYEAIMDLIKKLDAQGHSLQSLESLNDGVVADMMKRMPSQAGQQQQQLPMPNLNKQQLMP
jgi:hypothetical protein